LLPNRMPAADEWLGDDNLKIGLLLKKALQANLISEKVIRQKMVGQIVEEEWGRLEEGLKGQVVYLARIIDFDDTAFFTPCTHSVLQPLPQRIWGVGGNQMLNPFDHI